MLNGSTALVRPPIRLTNCTMVRPFITLTVTLTGSWTPGQFSELMGSQTDGQYLNNSLTKYRIYRYFLFIGIFLHFLPTCLLNNQLANLPSNLKTMVVLISLCDLAFTPFAATTKGTKHFWYRGI